MSAFPLRGKLEMLQCQFTWNLDVDDKNVEHILQSVSLRIQHTIYSNRAIFYNLQAYLHHYQGNYRKALQSLEKAEAVWKQNHPTNFDQRILVTYGNYAWVHYYFCDYDSAEMYFRKVEAMCGSLSQLSSAMQAEKGWTLLVVGFRHGAAAQACFEKALEEDPNNPEVCTGLTFACYAQVVNVMTKGIRGVAIKELNNTILREPCNYEAKVYLARLLKNSNSSQAEELLDEIVKNSQDPEILRNAAKIFKIKLRPNLTKSIEILKQAIVFNDTYDLLYRDLGNCYIQCLRQVTTTQEGRCPDHRQGPDHNGGRVQIITEAIQYLKRASQLCPSSIFSKLYLAEMYGENGQQDYQEEIYQNIMVNEFSKVSILCHQVICCYYGTFLFQKKNLYLEASMMLKESFQIPFETAEREQSKYQLKQLAEEFMRRGQWEEAKDINKFIQEAK